MPFVFNKLRDIKYIKFSFDSPTYKQLRQHFCKPPRTPSDFRKFKEKNTYRQIYKVSQIVGMKNPVSLNFQSLWNSIRSVVHCVYSTLSATDTGHGTKLAFCRMGTVPLSWGHIGWKVALAIHQTLAQRLKKEYSYTSTPPLGRHDLFYCEPYLLAAKRVRRGLLQYTMYRNVVVVIAVLTAYSSGWTVLRK